MPFFETATSLLGTIVTTISKKLLTDSIETKRTQRRLERLVDDAVERVIEQIEAYFDSENLVESKKELLIATVADQLRPFAEDPQRFFRADLDGERVFEHAHPNGVLPQEIREDGLEQFYVVLFRQVAQLIAASPLALRAWQAEGYREGFTRLSQLADAICAVGVKVVEVPEAVVSAFDGRIKRSAEMLLRDTRQMVLSKILPRIDISPLRAERALHGALRDHFVIPALRRRTDKALPIDEPDAILRSLVAPGARSLVYGGAGIGKTTWSTWLQVLILEKSFDRLAVVMRLRAAKGIETTSLLTILQEHVGVHLRERLTIDVLEEWLECGRLAIIFDGFDEVPEDRRDAVLHWLSNLAIIARQSALLVTTRPLQSNHFQEEDLKQATESPSRGWAQWELMAFDTPRTIEFITRWHRHLPEGELSNEERNVDAPALAQTFASDPSLKPLSDTPLMLGTLLFVHHRDKRLPSGRCDLYQRYVSAMLGLRDSGLGIVARSTRLTDHEKRQVLGVVATHFQVDEVNEVGDAKMCEIVSAALGTLRLDEDVNRLLAALSERSGLLQGPGTWSFVHKTIGEFLMAEIINNGTHSMNGCRMDRLTLWSERHSDSWTSVLFFWAGLASEKELEQFIRDLLQSDNTESIRLALSLLHDQGDRLPYDVQRELALKIITFDSLVTSERLEGKYGYAAPSLPAFAHPRMVAPLLTLRGLTRARIGDALELLIARGTIQLNDVLQTSDSVKRALTVAAYGVHRDQVLHGLPHVSQRDLAFLSFGDFRPIDVESWLEANSEFRSWLVPLIFGRISGLVWRQRSRPESEHFSEFKYWVRKLADYHGEVVSSEWLAASSQCTDSLGEDGSVDVLAIAVHAIEGASSQDLGLTEDQRVAVMELCRTLRGRRESLERE
jgi:hypothetical protein